jgi:hypothetical protein
MIPYCGRAAAYLGPNLHIFAAYQIDCTTMDDDLSRSKAAYQVQVRHFDLRQHLTHCFNSALGKTGTGLCLPTPESALAHSGAPSEGSVGA